MTKNTAILQGKQTKGLKRIAGQKAEREKQANKEIKRQNTTKHKMWSKFVTNPVLYFSFHIHRFFPSMFSIHNRYIKIDCRLRLCPLQGILGTVTIADPDLKRLAKLRSYIQRRSGCSGYVTDMRKRIFSSVVHVRRCLLKRLRFDPKNFILMTPHCPEFRHHFRMLLCMKCSIKTSTGNAVRHFNSNKTYYANYTRSGEFWVD